MVLAAWGALAGVLAHATIDFGLTLPANAFLLATLAGLACGVKTAAPKSEPEERAIVWGGYRPGRPPACR